MWFVSSSWWIGKCSIEHDDIPNYEMPQRFVEEEFMLLDDDEDEDEDASESNEIDEFDLLTDQEIQLVVEQWLFEVISHYKKCWNCWIEIANFIIPRVLAPRICDALCDLVPFAQFKNMKNTHGRVLILVKLQAWSLQLY